MRRKIVYRPTAAYFEVKTAVKYQSIQNLFNLQQRRRSRYLDIFLISSPLYNFASGLFLFSLLISLLAMSFPTSQLPKILDFFKKTTIGLHSINNARRNRKVGYTD